MPAINSNTVRRVETPEQVAVAVPGCDVVFTGSQEELAMIGRAFADLSADQACRLVDVVYGADDPDVAS